MVDLIPDTHVIAARIVGKSAELDALGARVEAAVKMRAVQHRASGDYIRSIRNRVANGPRGVRDRVIETTDPGALSIEYGRLVIHKAKGARRASWGGGRVPGQFIFTKAFAGVR